jgi:O-antigen ligase
LGLSGIFKAIFASGVFQAILAIAQFYKQSSLGLKFIEAGSYAPGEAGVATFISGTEKVMRAYGSFPHPNVLAAFLLLAIFCFYALWLSNSFKNKKSQLLYVICYMLHVFALFLTFSRGTILVFVFVSFAFFIFRFFQLRTFYHTDERLAMGKRMMILALFFVIFSVISALLVLPYFKTRFIKISLEEEAIDLRFFYNKMAVEMIKEKPFLGIGMGNFANYSREFPAYIRAANKIYNSGGFTGKEIPEWLYQPAHNIYLLIASEIGIFGALIFIVFLLIRFSRNIRPIKPKELSVLVGPMIFLFVGFLILGLNDHYFWTLQSGEIMFWLSLALISHNTQHVTHNN